MSDGENLAPVLLLPEDAGCRDSGLVAPFWRRDDWPGIIAALLLHLVVIVAFLTQWRWPVATPPESIPVTIVFAPPPAPEAAPQPPPQAQPYERESGADERTTAPPAAEAKSDEATRAPAAAQASPTEPQASAPAAAKPAPAPGDAKAKTHDKVARLDPRREADRARAQHPAPDLLRIEPGDRQQTGDPYLNRARDLIERHRIYPNVLGRYGVPVEGTPVYEFLLDRKGRLLGLKLVTSSGTAALDEAGAGMIRAAAPFPPLPPDAPGTVLHVIVTLPLYPK